MKKTTFLIVLFLATFSLYGQKIAGTWNGILEAGEVTLRVDFHITSTDDGYSATLDSPDQNAYGIPVSTVEFTKPDVAITVVNLNIEYEGKLEDDNTIKGTFTQMGQSFEMDLKKKVD